MKLYESRKVTLTHCF